jgi:hypothetical protein
VQLKRSVTIGKTERSDGGVHGLAKACQ